MNILKALDNLGLAVVDNPDNSENKLTAVLMFPVATFDYAYNHFRTIDSSSFRQINKKLHTECKNAIVTFWKLMFKDFSLDEHMEVTDIMDSFQERLKDDINIIFFSIDRVISKQVTIDSEQRRIISNLVFVWLLTDMTEVYFQVVGLKKFRELKMFNLQLKKLITSLEKEWLKKELDFNSDNGLRNSMVVFMNKSKKFAEKIAH